MSDDILKKLNETQQIAISHEDGPLLVVAGAGTGKTTLLIARLVHLLLNQKYSSNSLLLLTFTEKAAGELEERADKALPYGYLDLWIHTFHSFGERILREHALDIGLPADFKMIDETEQWILVRNNLERFKLNYYRPLGNPTKFISELLKHFSRLKDENIPPAAYLAVAGTNPDLAADEKLRQEELAGAYQTYNQLLLENSYLDFGDLIVYTLKLFKERPQILAHYQKQFRQIMVDEFQDTNGAQYELVKLLALPNNNLTVVGDDDQSIYKFRGASISNILQFKDDFPEAKELVLTDNYRSRQEILDYAYRFIQNNNPYRLEEKLKLDKQLHARADFSDLTVPAVSYQQFLRAEDEVAYVVDKIQNLHDQGLADWTDCAILIRANNMADAYVKELVRQNIPHQFVSLRGLYFKTIILDCLAYLRLLNNFHDSASLYRLLNLPQFKVAYLDLIAINKVARKHAWSVFETLNQAGSIPDLSPDSQAAITRLLKLIKDNSARVSDMEPSRLLLHFLNDSGLLTDLDFDRDAETFSYLNQFYQKIKNFEKDAVSPQLRDFVALMDLELEAGQSGSLRLEFADNDTVKVMTIHSAKGLEFKYVFVVTLVDKRFPTINRSEKIALPEELLSKTLVTSGDSHLEEERRLFYVAATRAKDQLFLTGAQDYGGKLKKKPSVFIEEMGLTVQEVGTTTVQNLELVHDLDNLANNSETFSKLALPSHFSFSQLEAYSACPLKYKFANILRIPTDVDHANLIFGQLIHSTLYRFLKPLEETEQGSLFVKGAEQELTEENLKKIYNYYWAEEGYRSPEERQAYYERGLSCLRNFWKDWQEQGESTILYLEKKFTYKLGGRVIRGTIDRVDRLPDGTLEIIDYKTGTVKETLPTDSKTQLSLYQLVLEDLFGVKVSRLTYYYLEGPKRLSFTVKPEFLNKVRQESLAKMTAISEGKFPPTPGPVCSFCDYNKICPHRVF